MSKTNASELGRMNLSKQSLFVEGFPFPFQPLSPCSSHQYKAISTWQVKPHFEAASVEVICPGDIG